MPTYVSVKVTEVEYEIMDAEVEKATTTQLALVLASTVMVVYPWIGIGGSINNITEQAIGVQSISFIGWNEEYESAVGVIADGGFSYTIGLQLNNGDEYDNSGQHIEIELISLVKTEMIVKLNTEFSVTNPDPDDEVMDDIHIWYKGLEENIVGQIDPWIYIIRILAAN